MIRVENTVLILLAAGRSERFGAADKLVEPFLGRPLALHVVTALESVPFKSRLVVKNGTDLDFESLGYRTIHNDQPEIGLSNSVKLGIAQARDEEAQGVVIALADMPRVTASHIYHLFEASHGPDTVVSSSDGVRPCPPALFGSGHFDTLMQLEGDAGARDMVRAGRHVVATPAELIDVDTPEDLARLRALV